MNEPVTCLNSFWSDMGNACLILLWAMVLIPAFFIGSIIVGIMDRH